MKHPKARTPKSAQASRTITRQSAMKNISRGPDSLSLTSSELRPAEIAELKRKFSDGDVFELPDSDISSPDSLPAVSQDAVEVIVDESNPTGLNGTAQSTKDKPQSRLPPPPKPFTIISGFRK